MNMIDIIIGLLTLFLMVTIFNFWDAFIKVPKIHPRSFTDYTDNKDRISTFICVEVVFFIFFVLIGTTFWIIRYFR